MTSTVEPAYDEGTTEQRDTMRQEPERKPEPHPTRGETATPPALNITEKQQTYGSGQRKEQKTRTPPSRTKGNIMKNNTFKPDHQRQPRFRRSGLRPVRTRQGQRRICSRRSSTSDPKACTGRRHINTTEGLALHVERKPFLMFRSSVAKNPATPATAHTAPHATTHNSWCFT